MSDILEQLKQLEAEAKEAVETAPDKLALDE